MANLKDVRSSLKKCRLSVFPYITPYYLKLKFCKRMSTVPEMRTLFYITVQDSMFRPYGILYGLS